MEETHNIIDRQDQLIWLNALYFAPGAEHQQDVSQTDLDVVEIERALNCISADEYEDWIRVGMALKAAGCDRDIWDKWSSKSDKYNPSEIEKKWNSFRGKGLGLGTVFFLAGQNGYRSQDADDDSNPKPTVTNRLLQLVEEDPSVKVFKVPTGESFAVFPRQTASGVTVPDTVPLDSESFRSFLRRSYRARYKTLCANEPINLVTSYLAGNAEVEPGVYVRVANCGEKIFVDLANDLRQVVEIAKDGWKVISAEHCPVYFWRPRGMLALPNPERGGDLSCLAKYMNLNTNGVIDQKKLARVILYLVSTFVDGPLMILGIVGMKGSAKTTQAKIIRKILDPHEADVMSPPADDRDLALACRNQWAVVIDNVSYISNARSDLHCRIATGAAWRERRLHTNGDEFMYNFRRPQILTSIKDVIVQSDLADRKLKLKLEPIPSSQRRTEQEIFSELQIELPKIIGALFDVVAGALREQVNVHPSELPRMADAAMLLLAAEKHLGWLDETVASMFEEEAQSDAQDMLDREPFAAALIEYVASKDGNWHPKPTEAVDDLFPKQSFGSNHAKWPHTPKALKEKLRELAFELQQLGLEYSQDQNGHRRYHFKYTPQSA